MIAHVRSSEFEAGAMRKAARKPLGPPFPQELGYPNVQGGRYIRLGIGEQTIALIAHDKRKREMINFVRAHAPLLRRFHRILATGTTGCLLKLLFAEPEKSAEYKKRAFDLLGGPDRLVKVTRDTLGRNDSEDLNSLIAALRREFKITTNPELANNLIPLASGPEGGDVLIAEEVLRHTCHTIVFFHDPGEAHPHEADIELLEREAERCARSMRERP